MLTENYIEALLVDEGLAEQVWEAWDAGEMNDLSAILARSLARTERPSISLSSQ